MPFLPEGLLPSFPQAAQASMHPMTQMMSKQDADQGLVVDTFAPDPDEIMGEPGQHHGFQDQGRQLH